MMLNVVLAEDHTMVLEGLRALLAFEEDIALVELCKDGEEAVEAVERHRPDILVMDVAMPVCDGLTACARLRAAGVSPPTVLLAATLDDADLMRAVELGVEGLVLKESAAAGLVDAIRAVARGERVIPPALSHRALDLLAEGRAEGASLTPREEDVARLVAAGESNKRVARALGLSSGTVKQHLHSVFKKLGVANRVQLSVVVRERDGG
ncbi:MAG: response regulator transcription factor [Gemmatimonadota bacterium]